MFVSIVSGSSGNCSLITNGSTVILVDCGLSLKRLEEALKRLGISPESVNGLLITHEHSDHIKSAGALSKKYSVPVFATAETHKAMLKSKIAEELQEQILPNSDFAIGGIDIHSFSIPHDAANPVGYSFFYDNNKVSIATDIGFMTDNVLRNIKGSTAAILESNHDIDMLERGPYPYYLKQRILGNHGHLSNKAAARTVLELVESGTKYIMLGHLSKENNTPDTALFETARVAMERGIRPGVDFSLNVASRDEITFFGVLKSEE